MHAFKGDQIVVADRRAGSRRAVVLGGDHSDGRPPLWVRWSDTGEVGTWSPTAGASVEHAGPSYPAEYDLS